MGLGVFLKRERACDCVEEEDSRMKDNCFPQKESGILVIHYKLVCGAC